MPIDVANAEELQKYILLLQRENTELKRRCGDVVGAPTPDRCDRLESFMLVLAFLMVAILIRVRK